jgi:beta-1,4-mannosyltransferase
MDAARPAAPRRSAVACLPPVLESNPYQRLLYEHLARLGLELATPARLRVSWLWRSRRTVRALHFHWPQPYYRASWKGRGESVFTVVRLPLFALRLAIARALGYRIVWTVHQVYPHESRSRLGDRLGALVLARASNALIAHDAATAGEVEHRLGRWAPPVAIVPHGSYVGVYPEGREGTAVRKELGVEAEAFVFIAFGLLRRYKDVGLLLEAFSATRLPDAVLLVAGRPMDEEVAETVRSASERDPRVIPVLEFVPDERVAELYAAADAAVVARGDGGTSGALVLALSFGLPVVAARTGAYEELLGDGAAGWLFEAGEMGSLGAALEAAASDPGEARRRAAAAESKAKSLAWPMIAERTAPLLLGPGRGQSVDGRIGAPERAASPDRRA